MKSRFLTSVCPVVICLAALLLATVLSPRSAAQTVSVTAATPNTAAQGTVNLNVTISGKGFNNGAKAQWFVTGTTNPGGVTVNSTAFVNSTTLTANITVAADAVIASFDIQVTNTNGRSGKGTELFAISSINGSPKATCALPPIVTPALNACSTGTAQTGCLDSTFGNGGLAETSSATQDEDWATRQQPDGKIVAMGQYTYPYAVNGVIQSGLVVERYNSDGSVDGTFGSGGVARMAITGTSVTQTRDGQVDSAGNIVMTGFNGGNTFVARFTASGATDTTFGTGGIFQFSGYGTPFSMALQPDGKIVVAAKGSTKNGTPLGYLIRINPNGGLDSTFGTRGVAQYTGAGFTRVRMQTVNGVNFILVATNAFSIVRFTLTGAVDTTFGSSGAAQNALCGYGGQAWDLALDPVSGIYISGFAVLQQNGSNKVFIAKYTDNGQLDSSFGTAANTGEGPTGATVLDFGAPESRGQLATTRDAQGNTLIYVGVPVSSNFYLARYKANGTLDPTWGGVGAVAAQFNAGWIADSGGVLVQVDGKAVQAGSDEGPSTLSPRPSNIALARFWP